MRRTRRSPFPKMVLALSLFLPAAVASPGPASAQHPKTTFGDVNFTGDEAFFTSFPCATTCRGLIKGDWYGGISGAIDADQDPNTVDSQEFNVSWSTTHLTEPRKWHLDFQSSDELCDVVDQGGFLEGKATGTVTAKASGTVDEVVGQIGGVLINTVTLDSTFTWERTGNGVRINFHTVTMQITTTISTHTIVDMPQMGSASFFIEGAKTDPLNPTSPPPPPPEPGCEHPIREATIEAAGHMSVVVDPPTG